MGRALEDLLNDQLIPKGLVGRFGKAKGHHILLGTLATVFAFRCFNILDGC
jgi:hypothetical protein